MLTSIINKVLQQLKYSWKCPLTMFDYSSECDQGTWKYFEYDRNTDGPNQLRFKLVWLLSYRN